MSLPPDLKRRLERLERLNLNPPQIGAAVWLAHETGELPTDPAMAAAIRPWLEALEAIERVQEGIPPEEEAVT